MDKPKIRAVSSSDTAQSVQMTADRVLVRKPSEGERSTKTGLLIPATAASVNKRCIWSEVVAVGPNVRAIETGDHVLHLPEGGLEVEIRGEEYILLRERDVHAGGAHRTDAGPGPRGRTGRCLRTDRRACRFSRAGTTRSCRRSGPETGSAARSAGWAAPPEARSHYGPRGR